MNSNETLRITEIFHSIQGESKSIGLPTIFIRLTGCPLRCQYCDTTYAFNGGEVMHLEEIVKRVNALNCPYVTVTGGEPLAQPNCDKLLSALCDAGFQVSIETSGALSIESLDRRISIVMDLKTPGSLECEKNQYDNIFHLGAKDQVKIVICNRKDYEWAKAKVEQYSLIDKVGEVLFSPSCEQLDAANLAEWVLDDKLNVRVQVQLHKILWGAEPGR